MADESSVEKGTDVELLLGDDVYDLICPGPTRRLAGGLKATKSPAGWVIHGGTGCSVNVYRVTVQESLEKFWELEHLGLSLIHI